MNWDAIGKFLWSWLPLIAILLTIYNVFLKNSLIKWWGKNNKKSLKKRLLELDKQAAKLEIYQKEPSKFYLDLLWDSYYPAGALIGVLFILIYILLTMTNIIEGSDFKIFYSAIVRILSVAGFLLLIIPFQYFIQMRERILYFNNPASIVIVAERLLARAKILNLEMDFDLTNLIPLMEKYSLKSLSVDNSKLLNKSSK
jgi:hypothetical protein